MICCRQPSWRKCSASAASRMMENRSLHGSTVPFGGRKSARSRLPLDMSSYTSMKLPLSLHQPSSLTMLRCRTPLMIDTSATNSFSPCFESWLIRFTATGSPMDGSLPRYTLPNPPSPSLDSSRKCLVAALSCL
ncbi:hypothetical protein Mapa_011210 [Marchantia paleacea]|nr:hypothetical protein Mapa_011210 [Marchantia paleacea]